MKIKLSSIRTVWVIFCLFVVIFNPPIVNFNLLHIVALYSWMFLIVNARKVREKIDIRRLQNISVVLLSVMSYLGMNALIHDNSITIVIDYFYIIFEIIPFCVYIVYIVDKGVEDVIKYMKIVSSIQAILGIAAFFIPIVKEYFNQRLISYGYGEVILSMSGYRQNGFAANLASYSSFFQAFMAVICFNSVFQNKKSRWINLWMSLMIAFSAVINARTSIVIITIGIIIVLASRSQNNIRGFIFKLAILIVAVFGAPILFRDISLSDNETYKWVSDGVLDIKNIFNGDVGGSTSFFYYYKDFWHLPSDISIIFGKGTIIMGSIGLMKYGVSSDVGFVNDIWKGGVLYSLILWGAFLLVMHRMMRTAKFNNNVNLLFFLRFFGIVSVIINFKGFFFVKEAQTIVFMLLFTAVLCNKYMRKEFLEEMCDENRVCRKK